MLQNQDLISRGVLIFLVIMSVGAWWYTIVNLIKNIVIKSRADRVMRTFWETPNAQDAIRFMEEQKPNEPFSKIALDCAQAAAHHHHVVGQRIVVDFHDDRSVQFQGAVEGQCADAGARREFDAGLDYRRAPTIPEPQVSLPKPRSPRRARRHDRRLPGTCRR
jgi:hypothetical protein